MLLSEHQTEILSRLLLFDTCYQMQTLCNLKATVDHHCFLSIFPFENISLLQLALEITNQRDIDLSPPSWDALIPFIATIKTVKTGCLPSKYRYI